MFTNTKAIDALCDFTGDPWQEHILARRSMIAVAADILHIEFTTISNSVRLQLCVGSGDLHPYSVLMQLFALAAFANVVHNETHEITWTYMY